MHAFWRVCCLNLRGPTDPCCRNRRSHAIENLHQSLRLKGSQSLLLKPKLWTIAERDIETDRQTDRSPLSLFSRRNPNTCPSRHSWWQPQIAAELNKSQRNRQTWDHRRRNAVAKARLKLHSRTSWGGSVPHAIQEEVVISARIPLYLNSCVNCCLLYTAYSV